MLGFTIAGVVLFFVVLVAAVGVMIDRSAERHEPTEGKGK